MNEPRPAEDLSAAQLFHEYATFVARFLFRLGVPAHAIQDTVQEVFLVVHQRGGYRPGPAKPTTYLALIASRAAMAQRRQQRLRDARQSSTELDEIHGPDEDPARGLERLDDRRRLQDALSRLDPALRETLLLAECEDETAPSIAHVMGVPVGTVYWRLHEARKKLQRALAVADASQTAAMRLAKAQHTSPALSRRARLSAILGLYGWDEQRTSLSELIDATRRAITALGSGPQRYFRLMAKLAVSTRSPARPTSKLALSVGAGALKTGTWLALAAFGVLATLQLNGAHGAAARGDTAESAREMSAMRASEGPLSAPSRSSSAAVAPGNAVIVRREAASLQAVPRTNTISPMVSRRAHGRSAAPRGPVLLARGSGRFDAPNASEHLSPQSGEPSSQATPVQPAMNGERPSSQKREEASEPASLQPGLEAREQDRVNRSASDEQELLLEAQALARAHRLVASRPTQSLAIVEGLSQTSLHGQLSEERDYIRVMALYGLGRRAEADRAAALFSSRYRSSVFRARVNAARNAAAPTP